MNQIETISYKLAKLSCAVDFDERFGRCLSEDDVIDFEKTYNVRLPKAYKSFLTTIGNGAPGPFGEIMSLDESLSHVQWDLSNDAEFLSKPFPLQSKVTLLTCAEETSFDKLFQRLERDEEYSQRCWDCFEHYRQPLYRQGSLPICDYGCGIFFHLVVSGSESGSIWIHDMGNDAGIFPLNMQRGQSNRVNFPTWYESWLDARLGHSEFKYGYIE